MRGRLQVERARSSDVREAKAQELKLSIIF